jgi:hypothetical protein
MAARHRRTGALQRLIVFAGPLCAGKTTLAGRVAEALGVPCISARAFLLGRFGPAGRSDLQARGAELEAQTAGAWLVEAVRVVRPVAPALVLDAARTASQVDALRQLGVVTDVFYITADEDERARRFAARCDDVDVGLLFARASQGDPPAGGELARRACATIDTTGRGTDEVLAEVWRTLERGSFATEVSARPTAASR